MATNSSALQDPTSLIASTAAEYGVNPQLALEVAIQESGLDQSAIGAAGEIGVFQLMPATAAALGVDPSDLAQNIQGGCMLLAQLMGQFGGNVQQVLAGYNWGEPRTMQAIQSYGANWFQYIPASTQSYVNSILGALGSQYTASVGPVPVSMPGISAAGVSAAAGASNTTLYWVIGIGLVLLLAFRDA